DLPGATRTERLLARPLEGADSRPTVVASFPHGPSWPTPRATGERDRRVRRLAATAIAVAGVLDLTSAVTPPVKQRLHDVLKLVPLAVPQTAAALTAVAGLGLILLARGV